MNHIEWERVGTAKWLESADDSEPAVRQHPCDSLKEAVRFVMEELEPDTRCSAWIETESSRLEIEVIRAIYPNVKLCSLAKGSQRTSTRA